MESINHSVITSMKKSTHLIMKMKAKVQKNSGWKKKNMKNISKNKVVEAILPEKLFLTRIRTNRCIILNLKLAAIIYF